jgi:hypothetical protein
MHFYCMHFSDYLSLSPVDSKLLQGLCHLTQCSPSTQNRALCPGVPWPAELYSGTGYPDTKTLLTKNLTLPAVIDFEALFRYLEVIVMPVS